MSQTMPMESATVPGTTLHPSRIALGTWAIGGWMWGGTDDAQAIATIKSAIDRGITLIDTAPAYGFGHAEELVGQALAEAKARDRVCIATKVGLDWNDGKVFRNASRARIRKEVDDSLRRLRTDVIDLYQVHWPDPKVSVEEIAEAMLQLYHAGKIRAIGVSNFSVAQMNTFCRRAAPHRSAAVQFVRAWHRGRHPALLPPERHRRSGLRPVVPRASLWADHTGHTLRPRRYSPTGPKIPGAAPEPVCHCCAAARSLCTRELRQARDPSCGAVGSGPRGDRVCSVGRAPTGPAQCCQRYSRLEDRCLGHARDRSHCRFLHNRIRWPRIHGSAGPIGCVAYGKCKHVTSRGGMDCFSDSYRW